MDGIKGHEGQEEKLRVEEGRGKGFGAVQYVCTHAVALNDTRTRRRNFHFAKTFGTARHNVLKLMDTFSVVTS